MILLLSKTDPQPHEGRTCQRWAMASALITSKYPPCSPQPHHHQLTQPSLLLLLLFALFELKNESDFERNLISSVALSFYSLIFSVLKATLPIIKGQNASHQSWSMKLFCNQRLPAWQSCISLRCINLSTRDAVPSWDASVPRVLWLQYGRAFYITGLSYFSSQGEVSLPGLLCNASLIQQP